MLTQCLLEKLGVMVDQPIRLATFGNLTMKIGSTSVLVCADTLPPAQVQVQLRELKSYLCDEHHVDTVMGSSLEDAMGMKWYRLDLIQDCQHHHAAWQGKDIPAENKSLDFNDDDCFKIDESSFIKGCTGETASRNTGTLSESEAWEMFENDWGNADKELSEQAKIQAACPTGLVLIADSASYEQRLSIEPERNLYGTSPIEGLIGITKPKKLGHVRADVFDRLQRLSDEQPNCAEAIEVVRLALCASYLSGSHARIPNLLLHGTPGTGKTRLMSMIAKIVGLPFRDIPLAGSDDHFKISGMSKYWVGSDAGLVARTMASIEYANPVFLFDEIDKTGNSQEHNTLARILLLLESDTAKHFRDDYLEFEVDVSNVSFIATANNIDLLPDPIISRFVCVEIPPLGEDDQLAIYQNIYRELCTSEKYGVFLAEMLPMETSEWLAREGGALEIRKTRNLIKLAMQRACSTLMSGNMGVCSEIDPIRLLPSHFRSCSKVSRRQMGFV
jgi:hypothetical protein